MSNERNSYTNCEPFEEWLTKSGGYPRQDIDITEPIDISLGVGAINEDGQATFREDKWGDTITLKVTSWIGTSAGARHVYGKLYIPGLNYKTERGISSSSGYNTPNYISGWKIDITKKLDQKAKDLDLEGHPADACFDDMEIGEDTTRWEVYEEDELIAKAKEVFNKWFTGGWNFEIENINS